MSNLHDLRWVSAVVCIAALTVWMLLSIWPKGRREKGDGECGGVGGVEGVGDKEEEMERR